MERNLGQWEHHHSVLSTDPKGYESIKLDEIESILTVRLSDETFRGMLNFMKATKVGSTLGQIQKALVRLLLHDSKMNSRNSSKIFLYF